MSKKGSDKDEVEKRVPADLNETLRKLDKIPAKKPVKKIPTIIDTQPPPDEEPKK